LNLWRNALAARSKRDPNGVWKFRKGKSKETLERAYQVRLHKAKDEKEMKKASRISLKEQVKLMEIEKSELKQQNLFLNEKLTFAQEENSSLKQENAQLFEEVNILKLKAGSSSTEFEPYRLTAEINDKNKKSSKSKPIRRSLRNIITNKK
jgi:hypothetical protein